VASTRSETEDEKQLAGCLGTALGGL